MGVWAALLLGWLAAATASQVPLETSDRSRAFEPSIFTGDDSFQAKPRDPADQWHGGTGADWTKSAANVPHLRTKRRIKKGDGHVISLFKHVPGRALNVANTIVSSISARDCAVYCSRISCSTWSHNNETNDCRFLTSQSIVAVPVVQPKSDYYEISAKGLGDLLFSLLFGGITSHEINVQSSQVRQVNDPLAPENVLTDYLEPVPPPTSAPVPEPTAPPTAPPAPVTTPPSPTPSAPPPTEPPVPNTHLSYQFPFPLDCGTRPTFGLLDHVRMLQPEGVQHVRVVGGASVSAGTFPWQAQIEIANRRGYEHHCGGIVISPNLILTAAHCHTKHESNYQVRVAQHNIHAADPEERILAVENIYRHSGYKPDVRQGQRNDIAVMKLRFRRGEVANLTFGDYVQPLCLPEPDTTVVVGQECQISGWGLTNSSLPNTADSVAPVLKGAIVNILDPAVCFKAYGDKFDDRLMVCAGFEEGGVDTCQGDSGGPLSCRDPAGQWYAAGIVSHGWECGRPGYPGVYTRTAAYLEFLHRTAAFLTGVSVV